MTTPTTSHVVVGAGPVGRATAALLAERGHRVVLANRSGTGPALAGVTRVPVDVTDADQVAASRRRAEVLYNCVNPPTYLDWQAWWPPVAAALVGAAERTGAVLAIAGMPLPLRPGRGSDDRGPGRRRDQPEGAAAGRALGRRARRPRGRSAAGRRGAGLGLRRPRRRTEAGHIARVAPAALAGKTVRVVGRADVLHSFTDVRDMARTLAAVADRPDTWGRVWHVPTNPARTQREVLGDLAARWGASRGRVTQMPGLVLSLGGIVVPMLREMRETEYQFTRPYVLDSAHSQRVLGLEPTPWDEVCRASAEAALATA